MRLLHRAASPPRMRSCEYRAASRMPTSARQSGENASQNQSFVQKISPRSLPANRTRQSRLVISLKISGHFTSLNNNNKKNSTICSICNESNPHTDGPSSTGHSHWDLTSADAPTTRRADRSRFVQALSPSLSGGKDAVLPSGSGNVGAVMLLAFPPQPALGLA